MALFDVLTIGAATQDIFLKSAKFEEVPNEHAPDGLSACIALGAKIALDDVIVTSGGGATNAAVTFAHFGLKTACLSRIGQDEAGGTVKFELKRAGVDIQYFQTDREAKTAYSMILLSGSGHRAILTFRGASMQLKANELPWMKDESAKSICDWIYLTSVAGDQDVLSSIFSYIQTSKTKIAWNPGNAELSLGLETLKPFLRQTNILSLNREEAAELADQSPRHLDQTIEMLAPLVGGTLIITDGEKGAYVHADGATLFAPALPAHRINTTGAGDAFGSAFTAAIIKGLSTEEALKVGMLNATSVISHMGAKAGILPALPSEDVRRDVTVEPYGTTHQSRF